MFDYSKMIKRATEFFPIWSDIRKRYHKSNGGLLLSSLVEETLSIEDAIKEYINYYLLDSYYNNEDSIMDYAHATNIGIIDNLNTLSVIYNDEIFPVTDKINMFIDYKQYSYYENGYIYIHENSYNGNNNITIIIDDESSEYTLNKTHVWNIFDEFACFVNMKRQPSETNKELQNRILYKTKNLPNGSEQGIKDAIISELLTLTPNITYDDIKIDTLNSDNLYKPYENFNTLLDMLSEVNRDVYKDKRWDLDYWYYDFDSISYIGHKWDEAITEWQNGVGYKDQLKTIISSDINKTDATITLYDKSEEKLLAYVHDKKINKNIKFKMLRYNNILNSTNVKYKVKASSAIDITDEEIELAIYEDTTKSEKRTIQDLFYMGKDVAKIDKSKITDANNYKLEFTPDSNLNMTIDKCEVLYKHKQTGEIISRTNLLKQVPGFILNADGTLVNTSVKKSVTSIKNMTSHTGLIDTNNGIELAPNINNGKGTISVNGLGLNFIKIEAEHNNSIVPKDYIKGNTYTFWKDDVLNYRSDVPQDKIFSIDIEANSLSFDVLDECTIDMFIDEFGDGRTKYLQLIGPMTYKVEETDVARKIKLKVFGRPSKNIRFNNFKYNNYSINYTLKYGELLKTTDNQLMLPNFNENTLTVDISTKTGLSPVLKYIYIGSDINKSIYRTDTIDYKTNCDRIFNIKTNCNISLLEVSSNGSILNTIPNYTPTTAYKATSDDAWIRLNTEEYSSIKEIISSIGSINTTIESGVSYYTIKLKNGDSISTISIEGTKSIPSRRITLTDMIKTYIPVYDKSRDNIYASKLSDGLIVSINDVHNPMLSIVKIKSNIFTGINASKYEFIKCPKHIGLIFGSDAIENQSHIHSGDFDYIAFYPAGAIIHEAINEYNMFLQEARNIKIVNNFAPAISLTNMNFYKVELFDKNNNIDIRFNSLLDTDKNFELLNDWALGIKTISIKLNNDLSNNILYDVSSYDIEEEILLSKSVDLKPNYSLANNFNLQTNKHIIIPPEGVTVEYKTYDGTDKLSTLIKSEEFIIEEDGFNKLDYSNIDTILYMGTQPYNNNNTIIFPEHQLLKDEGIIVWTDLDLIKSKQKIYVRYTIKEPIALVYSTEALYKAIEYTVNAYKEIDRLHIHDMLDKQRYDLKQLDNYKEADLIHVSCNEPNFEAVLSNSVLKFNKFAKENTILIKTGYYYINGREYYLFSNNGSLTLDKNKAVEYENIEISGGEITLRKTTDNYVRNSEMLLRGMNSLYNFDCSKNLTYGVSSFNSLTACDNFNEWNVFGTKMYLKDGYNDLCLGFIPQIENGYAYINITKYLNKDKNYISFWASEKLNIFIAKEKHIDSLKFPNGYNLELEYEIKYSQDNFRESVINNDNNSEYYLVVKGSGDMDDIIITDKELDTNDVHVKNIDKLGLEIKENRKSGSTYRIKIDDDKYCINNGAAITSDNYIKTVSNINWGLTTIKSYEYKKDFMKCSNQNIIIENDYIYTQNNREGYIETPPIFIDNPLTIKRLFFKVNNINFSNMKDINVSMTSSNSANGPFAPVVNINENNGFVYGDYLSKYIKLKVDIPKNKYIDNISIYAEYKSNKEHAPKAITPNTGSLISKVYDIQDNLDIIIKSIKLDDVSNINDIEVSIRAAKDDYSADVWMPWIKLELDENMKLKTYEKIEASRFIQVQILLKHKDAYVKFNNIDIEIL